MKDRILGFLKAENKSSAQFAEEIGVQPSGISHILSGRNKPSLDFIIKMLERYNYISTEWLLFGKGKMLKETIIADLFSNELNHDNNRSGKDDLFEVSGKSDSASFTSRISEAHNQIKTDSQSSPGAHKASRIVIFYSDDSFREYFPG